MNGMYHDPCAKSCGNERKKIYIKKDQISVLFSGEFETKNMHNTLIVLTTPGNACSGVGGRGGEDVLESLLDSFDEPQPPLPHTCPS